MSQPTITQWCPKCCLLVLAQLYLERKGLRLVADKSTCPNCGLVLWSWQYELGAPLPRRKVEQLTLF